MDKQENEKTSSVICKVERWGELGTERGDLMIGSKEERFGEQVMSNEGFLKEYVRFHNEPPLVIISTKC